jgi:hypothetical protein
MFNPTQLHMAVIICIAIIWYVINTTSVTSGAGTAYYSGAHAF